MLPLVILAFHQVVRGKPNRRLYSIIVNKLLRHFFSFSILFLGLISCDKETVRELECSLTSAKYGYFIVAPISYEYEYLYTYTEGKLTEVKRLFFDSREVISTTEFEYDAEGRVSLETSISHPGEIQYRYYDYQPRSLITTKFSVIGSDTTIYLIAGSDTTYVFEEQYFYVKNPEDKVYHHPFDKSSLKFQNGNLIEYGYYEVSGTDTTDTFYERYFYDNHVNYFNHPEYRSAIPSDFIWAKVVSKNNLVRAQYIGLGWDFFFVFAYDKNGKIVQYQGKPGITIDFGYDCR